MKGTLFSADFIEDVNGDLRLLEVNTDTSVTDFTYFDYTDFITVLESNNITKLVVVHKPLIHKELVKSLKLAIDSNASFIQAFEEVKVGPNVIYPPTVLEEEGTFVLRLAYDETSIFDSEYAKGKLNLLTLFYDAREENSVVEFYHSSTLHGTYDSITKDKFNENNIPDAVVKTITESHRMAGFYKIGSQVEGETSEDRWNKFISEVSNRDTIVQKYHTSTSALQEDKVNSVRTFSIVYGSNLNLVHLAYFKKYAIFDLPTEPIYDETTYVNKVDNKHFHEFATNYIKYDGQSEGILNTHLIIKSDDTEEEAGNLVVGDELKSYFVDGTSLHGDELHVNNWHIKGKELPVGSYMTSSVIVYKNTKPLDNKSLSKITVTNNEDSIYVSPVKSFLVWDSTYDIMTWKTAIDINENSDYLINYDGSTVEVTGNELYITNDDGLSLIELDVEDTDTYIIAGTTPINSFITHNAPCFVAGTLITLADGSVKKIEEVQSGDVVATFDLKAETIVENKVNAVLSKTVEGTVEYKFDNGETVRCTFDHPIYIVGKGWTSFNSALSNEAYSLEQEVKQVEIGDTVKLHHGETKIAAITVYDEKVTVYNLQDIEGNHNFFANNVLVHNRFCFVAGTQITMADGTEKSIEDVVVGDEVLSFNGTENESKRVIDLKAPTHKDIVKYVFSNQTELICTHDHPIFTDGGELASYAPELTNSRYDLDKEVKQIKVGDLVFVNKTNSQTAVKEIIELDLGDTQTYIFTVEDNHNFYANGILVHNK